MTSALFFYTKTLGKHTLSTNRQLSLHTPNTRRIREQLLIIIHCSSPSMHQFKQLCPLIHLRMRPCRERPSLLTALHPHTLCFPLSFFFPLFLPPFLPSLFSPSTAPQTAKNGPHPHPGSCALAPSAQPSRASHSPSSLPTPGPPSLPPGTANTAPPSVLSAGTQ